MAKDGIRYFGDFVNFYYLANPMYFFGDTP